ncbi:hypothetical protein VTN49DRAFT_1268 [Thermomyces lanuginosus]|uniref:uncharacterized protein n=1 Tax=Thermomyces lanuginosus TaxID=5541 RepID=UPI0037433F0A
MPIIPIIPICFQCGTNQNPCRCKVVGPTAGFVACILAAVVCWPASIFCGCWATKKGSDMLGYPVKLNGQITDTIPI